MKKVYIISESQYKSLIEKKKEEKKIFNKISEELDNKKKSLIEGNELNEGVIDTIKKYLRAGALTGGILASLLASQKIDAQQLIQAGVPKDTIELAMNKIKFDPSKMTHKEIQDKILQIMKKNELKGSLNDYEKLTPHQKNIVLSGIKNQIKSLDDINHISVTNWEAMARNGINAVEFAKKTKEVIRVETIDTLSTVPMMNLFNVNSFELANEDSTKQSIHELLIGFHQIDSIIIESSSSTLRNRGDADGMTWKELSQKRGESIANLLIGNEIDLGGCGVNKVGKITSEMVIIKSDGKNGDGTSGPRSPYESSPEYVKNYEERGIDSKYWKSTSKIEALPETQIDEYKKYQYVNIKIFGRTVETETEDVPSFRYVLLNVRKMGGQIEKGNKRESTDVSKCNIKVKKTQMVNTSSNPFVHKKFQ